MRLATAVVLAAITVTGEAHSQAFIMPADADLRAMQAPVDYEGSRAQAYQEEEHVFTGGPRSLLPSLSLPSLSLPGGGSKTAAAEAAPAGAPVRPVGEDFTVDIWDEHDRVVETIARSTSLAVARAAFKEATKERPHTKVTLRRGETVVASKTGH